MGILLKVFLFLYLCISVNGVTVDWTVKRSVGDTIIWQSQKDKDLRGSSRLKSSNNILTLLKNGPEIIKKFESDKRKALALTGVRNWTAYDYQWQGKESLTVTGSYKDRRDNKVSFVEVHLFNPGKHLIVVATHKKGKDISEKIVLELVDTITKAKRWP